MPWQDFIAEIYLRLTREFENIIDGLTLEDLHRQPAPDANPIGWLLWHATRSLDRTVGDVMLGEQLWLKDGWYARFGCQPDPNETGFGHSFEEVARFRIPDVQTLRDYHRAVVAQSVKYLQSLSENELDCEFDNSAHPGTKTTVSLRIIGNINDCFQHIGQAAYVRGLLKGQGWLGR